MIPILAGPSIGKCHNQIEVLILVAQEAFQLVLGLLPFPQNVGQRFRQPHLTDTGIGFRLFQNNSCAGVRHERSEDVIDILLAQRFNRPFGSPRQLLVDVDIGVIRQQYLHRKYGRSPGQPQDFAHTQRAGKGKVHCHIEFAVRAFVQGKCGSYSAVQISRFAYSVFGRITLSKGFLAMISHRTACLKAHRRSLMIFSMVLSLT